MIFVRSAIFCVVAISLIATFSLPFVQADDQPDQQAKNRLIKELEGEKEKQIHRIKDFQEEMQKVMPAFDDIKEKEKLFRQSLHLEEVKLVSFEATRDVVIDRIKNVEHLPIEVLTLNDPELQAMNTRRDRIKDQRELITQSIRNPSTDKRVQQFDEQIKEIDDRIKLITDGADEDNMERFRKRIRIQEGLHLHHIERQIREQEIIVATLTSKYRASKREKTQYEFAMQEIAFGQFQINWANKLVEEIDRRILALQIAPQVDNTQDTAEQSQIDRTNKILEQIDNRIRSLQTDKPEASVPANSPTIQDQLRQINERLERIELLLQSINRKP